MTTARNRNAQRSQKLLLQAFSELLAEKPFEKITVTDITTRADLSRGTFYVHYESTTELLRSLVEDIMQKIFDVADTAVATKFFVDPDPVIELVADYLAQDESLFRSLIGSPAAESFIAYVKQGVIARLMKTIEGNGPFKTRTELHLGVTYVAGGLIDIVCAWLRGEFGDMKLDEISSLASSLSRSVTAS